MANVTITVDDGLLTRARARAVRLGTSINAVLRDRLEEFAGGEVDRRRALADLFALAAKSNGRSRGRGWTRGELYER